MRCQILGDGLLLIIGEEIDFFSKKYRNGTQTEPDQNANGTEQNCACAIL
jgi:hypothetical protein